MNAGILLTALAGVALVVPASTGAPLPPTKAQVTAALDAARKDPANAENLKAALAVLPKVQLKEGGAVRTYYVFEGDQLLTAGQVAAALDRLSKDSNLPPSPELTVLHVNGADVILPWGKRALTYAIDRASFNKAPPGVYASVVADMKSAAGEWVDACSSCGLSFTHLSALDKGKTFTGADFVVRYESHVTDVVASSFFPNDPPFRRTLVIAPGFFEMDYAHDGVLRHELGHIIGYRHEHLREVSGCFLDPEDNNWRPIGEYDPKSVMHYLCGRGGNYELHLSDTDKQVHLKLYSRKEQS